MRLKLILVSLCICAFSSLNAQTTLERNAKASDLSKEINVDYSKKYLFSYQPDISLAPKSILPDFFNPKIEVKPLATDDSATVSLKKELSRAASLLFKSRAEISEQKLNVVSDSFDVLDFNVAKLVNYTWDVYNKVDTGSRIDSREAFFDTLVAFRTTVERFSYRGIEYIADSLNVLKEKLRSFSFKDLLLSDTIQLTTFDNRIQQLKADLKEKNNKFKEYYENWNRIVEKFIKKKEAVKDTKDVGVTTLPFFNVIPGLRDISGTLSVFGSNSPASKKGIYTEFGGYTGILGSADELNRYSLFLPDISTYGFFFRNNISLYSAGDTSKTKVGFNFSFYYLGKKIKSDTLTATKSFPVNSFHAKIGLEYVAITNFSLYLNANLLTFLNNRDKLKALYPYKPDVQNFVDFGFRMLLNPSQAIKIDNWKLYFDLNFLVNKGDVKGLGNLTDVVIPNFRVGLRKTFDGR